MVKQLMLFSPFFRVLCEFQSRKAHRVLVRDVDMLKYLCIIVLIVVGYMAAWTAVSVDHLHEGNTMIDHGMTPNNLKYEICKSRNWDYIVELGQHCCLLLLLSLNLLKFLCSFNTVSQCEPRLCCILRVLEKISNSPWVLNTSNTCKTTP